MPMPNKDEFVQAQQAPQVVPQGSMPTGTLQTTQKILPQAQERLFPQAESALTKAQQLQEASIRAQEESAYNIAAIQQQQAQLLTAENERLYKEYNDKQLEYTSKIDAADRNIASARTDYQTSNIDSNRIFKADNNNRILAGISLALGAMGSALTGQKNYAMDIINSIVDRDIEEQKYEASKKYTAYENAKKEREILDSRFENDVDKLMFAKNMRLDVVKTKIESMIAGAKSAEIKANAQKLLADLNEQIAQNKLALFQNALNAAPTVTTQIGGGQSQVNSAQKQQAEITDYENFKTKMLAAYQGAGDYGVIKATLPSWAGGERSTYEAQKAILAGAIIGKVPGIKSDKDFKEVIEPLLPKSSDTPEAIARNKKIFENFLDTSAPSAWVQQQKSKQPVNLKTFEKR